MASKIFEPTYYRLLCGFDGVAFLKEIESLQWQDASSVAKYQSSKLHAILSYAKENIPYYGKIMSERNLRLDETDPLSTLRSMPILTKSCIKKSFDDLSFKRIKHFVNKSGGSTGEPVRIYQDYEFKGKMLLAKRLQKSWAGYSIGEREVKLWGSEVDLTKSSHSPLSIVANGIRGVVLLNCFRLDRSKMLEYAKVINDIKPRLVLGYSNVLYEFALFAQREKIKLHKPNAVMSSAGTLHNHIRDLVEEVFDAPVFDRYGSRECGDMACECEKHEGLHVMPFAHVIEILDDNLKPCKPGVVGNVYVTTLLNKVMPLIRYRIGDRACWASKKCSCGRGFASLSRIEGRETDVFRSKNGVIVPGEFFVHYIGVVMNEGHIDKFQVLQQQSSDIVVKYVSDNDLSRSRVQKITAVVHQAMGGAVDVRFERVKEIALTSSGKFRYTISEVLGK